MDELREADRIQAELAVAERDWKEWASGIPRQVLGIKRISHPWARDLPTVTYRAYVHHAQSWLRRVLRAWPSPASFARRSERTLASPQPEGLTAKGAFPLPCSVAGVLPVLLAPASVRAATEQFRHGRR
jgi:hypothetical protein